MPNPPRIQEGSAEAELVEATRRGEVAQLDGYADPVRAEVVRSLMLGIPLVLSSGETARIPTPAGVRLAGTTIEGRLDLSDAGGGDSQELPSLALEDSVLPEPLSLDDVHLRRLSLANSRIERLSARGLHSHGLVDLSGVKPPSTGRAISKPTKPEHVDLQGARLTAGLTARSAEFRITQPIDPEKDRYALKLRGARLGGDLVLDRGFHAHGGVDCNAVVLEGDFSLTGAVFVGVSKHALTAQGIRITGNVHAQAEPEPDGTVRRLFRAEGGIVPADTEEDIDSDLEEEAPPPAAEEEGDAREEDAPDEPRRRNHSLWFWGASLDGTFLLEGADVKGSVVLANARIQGDLRIGDGTELEDVADFRGSFRMDDLSLNSALVGGTVRIVNGRMRALFSDDLSVGDDVYLCSHGGHGRYSNAKPRRDPPDRAKASDRLEVGTVWLQEARIGGSLVLDGFYLLPDAVWFRLDRSEIGGHLFIGASELIGMLCLAGVQVGGSATLKAVRSSVPSGRVRFDPGLDLGGAKIEGDFEILQDSRFHAPIRADALRVGGSICVRNSTLGGGSSLEGADVFGDVKLESVRLGTRDLEASQSMFAGDAASDPADHRFRGLSARGELRIRELGPDPRERAPSHRYTVDQMAKHAHEFSIRALRCWPEWSVVEATSERNGQLEVFSFLWSPGSDGDPGGMYPLDGTSPPLHAFNEIHQPNLTTRAAARDYLKFFCGYMWAEQGPFRILSPASRETLLDRKLPDELTLHEPEIHLRGNIFRREGADAFATVLYGEHIFHAHFSIDPDGRVEMLEDRAESQLIEPLKESYEAPFRRISVDPDGDPDGPIRCIPDTRWVLHTREDAEEDGQVAAIGHTMKESLAGRAPRTARLAASRARRPRVDLSNATVDRINDVDGRAWHSELRLYLDGLRYDRAPRDRKGLTLAEGPPGGSGPVSKQRQDANKGTGTDAGRSGGRRSPPWRRWGRRSDRITSRMDWLGLQYPNRKPNRRDYRPHPYETLAAAFQSEGALDEARAILSHKLSLERKYRKPLWERPLWWWYGFFFDHGLSPARALGSCALLWLVGIVGTYVANSQELLVVDFTPASTVVISDTVEEERSTFRSDTVRNLRFAVASADPAVLRPSDEVPCGDMIFEAFYALDVMVPVLDFDQEGHCKIRSAGPPLTDRELIGEARAVGDWLIGWIDETDRLDAIATRFTSPSFWAFLKTAYEIAGAVVISLAILTFSGLARRHVER